MFQLPAGIDDLADLPQLREQLLELWNSDDDEGFMGRYTQQASRRSPNYVDPRVEPPPPADAVKVPWNGFPRLLSRWFDDEASPARKAQAEMVADIPTPIVSWISNNRIRQIEQHRVGLFGQEARDLARPLRYIRNDGTLGAEVPMFRRQQDEYLEWHATRDEAGKLVALTFTAESPDYWMALAQVAPDRVLKLYRQLTGQDVKREDLFHPFDLACFGADGWSSIGGKGGYNELNRWTTVDGIVHLTHQANTLGAEVTLGADASNVWASDNAAPGANPPAPEIRRIACGSYGGINRSSDPLIGLGVGGAVARGSRVTLTDPVGLYIATVNIDGLKGPQGQPVGAQALKVLRGSNDPFEPRILRFEMRLPAGSPFALGDCTLDGRALSRGGQVARKTTVHLYASLYPTGGNPTPKDCEGRVCRHPQRSEVFTIGAPGGQCPAANNLGWLAETPLEISDEPILTLARAQFAEGPVGGSTLSRGRTLALSRQPE